MLFEEVTSTLLCGDVFSQVGDGPALTSEDVVEAASFAEDIFGASCITPSTGPTIRRFADLAPRTLAIMHGSSFNGDTTAAIEALADNYDARLVAASIG